MKSLSSRPAPKASAQEIKDSLSGLTDNYDFACRLESNGRADRYNWVFALGASRTLHVKPGSGGAFEQLQNFRKSGSGWLFGWFGYDLKNETCLPQKKLGSFVSALPDHLQFDDLFFFEPENLYVCKNGEVECLIGGLDLSSELRKKKSSFNIQAGDYRVQSDFKREEYLQTVEKIRQHIREGDVYEVNLCQQFFADEVKLNGHDLFHKLNETSRAPFSAWIKNGAQHLICTSPERYIRKCGRTIQSQPIKGTVARGLNRDQDRMLIDQLVNSEKDRAENVMIVDLVRNDFARVCKPGSVRVPELFGRHTFEHVHHLISTVEGELKDDCSGLEAVRASFPMGSMTGAPKTMALQLIEAYEKSRRGVYSGAAGYFTPDDDFDFNVIIRSALYHSELRHLRFPVGGAITWDSVPESEYSECLLKAEGFRQVFLK